MADNITVMSGPYYQDKAFYLPYVEKYGKGPKFIIYRDEDAALKTLLDGVDADVAQLCAASLERWAAEGAIHRWDDHLLRRVEVEGPALQMREALGAYADYFVPVEVGTTRLVFDPLQVPADDVRSLDIFVDPKYAGRLALPAFVDDLAAAALLAQGVTDWRAVTDADFANAIAWLDRAKKNVKYFWSDEETIMQDMVDGDVLAAWVWNSVFFELQSYRKMLALAPETSGVSLWVCGYARTDDSPEIAAQVHDFANASVSEGAARKIMGWGEGFADATIAARVDREGADRDTGLTLPPSDHLLLQTPMPDALREDFLEAIRAMDIRS